MPPVYFNENMRNRKLWYLSLLSCVLGFVSTFVALVLLKSIDLFTNLAFYGRLSLENVVPTSAVFGGFIFFLPIVGGLIAGLMARFGSPGIRGHGIPEAMDTILNKDAKIPQRLMFLKPLSSAIVIGTGGPFGAEGPIIATGGAIGSFFGQLIPTSVRERKILLAAGAAAGMTAIFGTPLSAILLAIELLLFEFSPKSFVPVTIAVSTAHALRYVSGHHEVIFATNFEHILIGSNMLYYFVAGAIAGGFACFISKSIFKIEDLFEKLPIHWMWWPAIGGAVVGTIGLLDARTLGVGYFNIVYALKNQMTLSAALSLFCFKYISWAFSLGSGTSGGTLAPILTLGSSLGLVLGHIGNYLFPSLGISPGICALVCMAAMFSGATRAVLTSIVFALEATNSPIGIAPLIMGCAASYLMSLFFLKETIMTEKIARMGGAVPSEFHPIKHG